VLQVSERTKILLGGFDTLIIVSYDAPLDSGYITTHSIKLYENRQYNKRK